MPETETPSEPAATSAPRAVKKPAARFVVLNREGSRHIFPALGIELFTGKPLRVVDADAPRLDTSTEIRSDAADLLLQGGAVALCDEAGTILL